jgi:hypothetical protein
VVDELEWVPENLTVKGDACARHSNTDKAGYCESNGNYDELDILSVRMPVSVVERVNLLLAYALSVLAYL